MSSFAPCVEQLTGGEHLNACVAEILVLRPDRQAHFQRERDRRRVVGIARCPSARWLQRGEQRRCA
jgi:hypothetical protein